MNITLYPHGSCRVMPWKNGGGVTEELFIYPAGTALADGTFEVRLSSAIITQGGPFSFFAGFTRYLGLVSGEPLRLTVEGRALSVAAGDEPYFFEGEWAVSCGEPAQPQRDINLFVRRENWHAQVLQRTGEFEVVPRDLTFVLSLDGPAQVISGDCMFELGTLDLWVAEGTGDVIHLSGEGRTWVGLLSRR